jgi:hypothetical protein
LEEDGERSSLSAVYLGASNGDLPEFFQLFVGAMEQIGITECTHVKSTPSASERMALQKARVVLLAGGDPWMGWESFEREGLVDILRERYSSGAVLMGVSAGAILLGQQGIRDDGLNPKLFESLGLAPFLISVHDEPQWNTLTTALEMAPPWTQGLGIPTGAVAILHPDGSLEAVRHALVEYTQRLGQWTSSLLAPPETPFDGHERETTEQVSKPPPLRN